MRSVSTRLAICAVAASLSFGCAATIQQKPTAPESQGFLAGVYGQLEPGTEDQAALRYIKPGVDWKQYHQILLDPVVYWASPDSEIAPDASQMLTTYFYNDIKQHLEKAGFPLAQVPGPGVLRVQLALLEASSATPVLRSISLILPQALLINAAQRMFTDSYSFSGHIEVAMKASDASTGEVVAAALDRRSGGSSIGQAAQWKWGDAEAAMDLWSERFTVRLEELRGKIAAK